MIYDDKHEPAFPHHRVFNARLGDFEDCDGAPGLTIRDYFAGKVLTGAMSSASNLSAFSFEERASMFQSVASLSYEMADAMLKERVK